MFRASYVQKGDVLNYKNLSPTDKISAGDVIVVGDKVAVAGCEIEVGQVGTIHMSGVYEMPISTLEVSMGEKVYWDALEKTVTKTTSGNTEIGYAAETIESTATKIKVKLVG